MTFPSFFKFQNDDLLFQRRFTFEEVLSSTKKMQNEESTHYGVRGG